jgi:D-alanyl-D-alanine carboxypeptidase/D-alanyl-D-alanine-endopeptidase (penicillin-binding protein 4)
MGGHSRWFRLSAAALAGSALAAVAAVSGAVPGVAAATSRSAPGAVSASSLQSAWEAAVAGPRLRHALIGAEAYDVTTGRTLASIHGGWRLTPGSVNKLYASAASLADWGDRFSLVTRVDQVRAGGAVYLVGGGGLFGAAIGSPGSGNGGLEQLATAVAARVRGGAARVVGVSTLLRGWTSGPGWDVSEVGAGGDPAVSTLTSDGDDVVATVAAGSRGGTRPVVTLDAADRALVPPGFFRIEDQAVTGPAGGHGTLFARCVPGTGTIVISGVKPLGSQPVKEYLAIGDPALFTAALFQWYLARDGVRLARPATTGTLPAGARGVGSYRSPQSLGSYLYAQNGWSVNEMAENLYRMLGVATGGTGSPQDAQAAITAYLARAHLPQDRVQVDGSGLSVLDEMSAAQLAGLLGYVAHQPYFGPFEHSLIAIGRTRHCTFMCGLMDGTAADGHVWLKTGNLANQWNYAGYARARNGDLIAFALLFDGLQGDNAFGQAIGPIDRMTVDAASWPDEPAGPGARASAAGGGGGDRGLPGSVAALLPAGVAAAVRRGYSPGDVVSASVVRVASGAVAAQSNGQTELQGGLLGRLATVATVLRHAGGLTVGGPEIQAAGRVSGGRVEGDLVLNGRYDPLLSRQQLAGLARSLARSGIRSVAGRLEFVAGGAGPFGDQAYGVTDLPFSTPQEDVGASFSPPASPLTADQDQVTIAVRGAARPGLPAQVTVEPAGTPVRLTGAVGTVRSGPSPAAVWQPGPQAYRLSGSVTPGERTTLLVAPPYPGLVAADWLLASLRSAGITVPGSPVPVTADPGGRRLAGEPAPALAAEAKLALTQPSNVAPFDLYQLLGSHAGADVTALTGWYDQIIDPSGNAADDFLTAGSISGMLAAVDGVPAEAPLVSLLNRPWIVRLPERTTMAGYATGPGGELLAYTVIVNGQLYDPAPDLPSRFEPLITTEGA